MLSSKADHPDSPAKPPELSTTYGSRYFAQPVPRYRIPEGDADFYEAVTARHADEHSEDAAVGAA